LQAGEPPGCRFTLMAWRARRPVGRASASSSPAGSALSPPRPTRSSQ
jgi:hypothetical protein